MDNVTKNDLKAFLKEMQVVLQVHVSDNDKKIIFEAWVDALEDITLLEFERAKKRLLQEWKYAKFPKPADFLDRVQRSPYKPIEKPKEKTPEEIEAARIARENFFKKVKELV